MKQENKSCEVVFGGGCFWCTEAIFKQINGVIEVTPGYSGGLSENPGYKDVCTGKTGFAEVVRIKYNPNEIAFEKLLEVFFLSHDPTSFNQQGADIGTQYRSVIFYTTSEQRITTNEIITALNESKIYQKPVITEVLPLNSFYCAETEHQNYYNRNKNQPYCQIVIQPKINKIKKIFENIIIK